MDVGTAKVPPAERRGIVHHQLDVLDPAQDASVARYQEAGRADLDAIAGRGARAVVVGGSGLYVRALLDAMDFPGTDPEIRARLEARAEAEGRRALHAELARLDPQAADEHRPAQHAPHRARAGGHRDHRPPVHRQPAAPGVRAPRGTDRAGLLARGAGRAGRRARGPHVGRRPRRRGARAWRAPSRAAPGPASGSPPRAPSVTPRCSPGGAASSPRRRPARPITANTRRLARKQMGWFGRDPRVHWLDAASPHLLDDALAIVAAPTPGRCRLRGPSRCAVAWDHDAARDQPCALQSRRPAPSPSRRATARRTTSC